MIEPDDKMIEAGIEALDMRLYGSTRQMIRGVWKAMWAAAEGPHEIEHSGGLGGPAPEHDPMLLGAHLAFAKLGDPESIDPKLRAPAPDPTWQIAEGKTVHLTLTWIAAAKAYKIGEVSNSAYYKPDLWIMEADLHKMQMQKQYTFSSTSPDYLGALLGIVRKAAPGVAPLLSKW